MAKRRIGRSELHVTQLSFGGNVFGWTLDEKKSFMLLDRCVDAGIDLIDTADCYSVWVDGNQGGESETIIGRWLKKSGKRDAIVLATKCGMKMNKELGRHTLSKSYILEAVDKSLMRLGVDHIDLYQAHIDDPDTPLQETLEAFTLLIKQGKVRYIGASNYSLERLQQANAISASNGLARFECLQPEYNMYDRIDFESGLQDFCVKEQIGVIPYFSLARGFLSGKYRSEADLGKSVRGGGVKKYLNARGMQIIDSLDKVAKQHGATPAQVALAWLMTQPAVTAPIASATNDDQFNDLIAATRLQLDKHSVAALDEASRQSAVHANLK